MARPEVSDGLPVYNGEKYLPNTLKRLLAQDFEDFELIVSDNASTDRTPDVCRRFADRDPRLRYVRNETNIGLAANHNRTVQLSRDGSSSGPRTMTIFRDRCSPASLAPSRKGRRPSASCARNASTSTSVGTSWAWTSDGVDKDDPWPHKRLAHLLRNVHMYNSAYGLIRLDVLRRTQLHGLYPMSDHVLLSELAMLGVFVELPDSLLRIRRHPGRTFTANKSVKALRELFAPGKERRFPPISMWMHVVTELVRSAALIPPKPRDKVLGTAVALVVPQWRSFRNVGGRQKQKLYKVLGSTPSPSRKEAKRP